MNTKNTLQFYSAKWIAVTAMFMALTVVMSSFGIPVPGGHFYLNDVIICTAAILLDPIAAFMVGGVGSFLGDFFFYPTPMFVSLAVHGLQAIVISLFTRAIKSKGEGNISKSRLAASSAGVTIGAVIMVVGYSLGRAYLYSTPEYAMLKLPYQILQAAIGAVAGVLFCYKFGLIKIFNRMMKIKSQA